MFCETVLRFVYSGVWLEILLLAIVFNLIWKDYAISEMIFDSLLTRLSAKNDFLNTAIMDKIQNCMNVSLNFLSENVIKPVKVFAKNQTKRIMVESLLKEEIDEKKLEDKKE